MSSRKPQQLTLSPKAQQDFIDILRYTGETWGEKQLLSYRDKIDEPLQAISGNPQLGQHRDGLPSTHHAYLVGSHVIVYRMRGDGVAVVRILHQRISWANMSDAAPPVFQISFIDPMMRPAICVTIAARHTGFHELTT